MFGPRWPLALPLALLAWPALRHGWRTRLCLALVAMLVLWAGLGFCVPYKSWLVGRARAWDFALRVVTYNAAGGANHGRFARFLQHVEPDVVVLQEWGMAAAPRVQGARDWHVWKEHEFLVASRLPIVRVEALRSSRLPAWRPCAFRVELESPKGPIQLIVVHLVSPRSGLQEVLASGWKGARALNEVTQMRRDESRLASQFAGDGSKATLVAGDFNLPVESRIYRESWGAWQNAFSSAGLGFGNTKFTRWWGVRIDHLLASRHWRVHDAWVGPECESDHRPVVADVTLRPG